MHQALSTKHQALGTDLPPDVVLSVRHVSKKFCRNLRRSMWYGMQDLARNLLGLRPAGTRGGETTDYGLRTTDRRTDSGVSGSSSVVGGQPLPALRKDEFWALQDVSFDLKRGEVLGLIGANGSGKTTMLRILTGIFPPDAGMVAVRGRLGALIALGAGFHGHMTGLENIYLNAAILGLRRKEVDARLEDIVNFAEIGEFLYAPVSTYSSGMYVRLGFAVAIHTLPDIVLVDEILAVGDAFFQRKCLDRIREMRHSGKSFILVTHNMQTIEAMCERVIWLHHGQVMMIGPPGQVIPQYELCLMKGGGGTAHGTQAVPERSGELPRVFAYSGFGTEEVTVQHVRLVGDGGEPQLSLKAEEKLRLEMELVARRDCPRCNLYVAVIYVQDRRDRSKDLVCFGTRARADLSVGRTKASVTLGRLGLATGEYKLAIHVFDETYTNPYSQGHYGYFSSLCAMPSKLAVGISTPFCWLEPRVELQPLGVVSTGA